MYVESGDFLGRLQGHLELETPTSLEEVMVQHNETELRIANERNIWRGKQRVGEEKYLLLNTDYGQGSIFGFLQ